jgi:hypothetical protein
MNIIFPNIVDTEPSLNKNTFYLIDNDELSYFDGHYHFVFAEEENTFVINDESYYHTSKIQEVKVKVDYTIPRKYKSISKSICKEYDEEYTPEDLNISGIYCGISMVSKAKYLFVVSDRHDEVMMLADKTVTIVTKQHLKDMYTMYLLADEVDNYLDDNLYIRIKV